MRSAVSSNYIQCAIERESAVVALAQPSTRNYALNRAAFKLGTIPDLPTDTAIGALLIASKTSGYLNEHGEIATRKVIMSGLRNGQVNLRQPVRRGRNESSAKPTTIAEPGATRYPSRTPSDAQGKPHFHLWGAGGPPIRSDQKRRHVYGNGADPVRIKIMLEAGGAVNWYRVQDNGGRTGWQARKPEGYVEVPYTGGTDPFDREVVGDDLFLPEGEKDCDTLVRIGLLAIMGGADGNGNVETREVLEPLAEMANRLRIAVVAVTHLNKGGAGNQNALNRFAGSIAFIAAARAAFAVIEDPDDDQRRLLLQAKNNLGKRCKGLAFRLEQRLVAEDIVSSNIMFESAHVTASIDEALNASEGRGTGEKRTNKDEAANFLRTVLAGGALPVLQIESEAREAGLLGPDSPISQNKAFRSAREDLGIRPQRQGGTGATGQWVWELPRG